MADVTRQGTALLVRWQELGNWAVKTKHGAAAVLAIMFALCLQRPVTAHPSCVEYAGPRIWLVKTPYGTQTHRVSLFDDDLMCALLKTVASSANVPTPVYPRTPCGSREVDVWAHSYASRKAHKGRKNFASLVADFGLEPVRSPMEIYKLAMGVFLRLYTLCEQDERLLLAWQLGKQRSPCLPMVTWPDIDEVGKLRIQNGKPCITMARDSDLQDVGFD